MATFGYDGGTVNNSSGVWDYGFQASKATLTEAGSVTKIALHFHSDHSALVAKAALYDDDGVDAKPGTRLGVTPEANVPQFTDGWIDFTFSTAIELEAGDYYITAIYGVDANDNFRYVAASGGTEWWGDGDAAKYATPPASWSFASQGSESVHTNMMATYTAGGTPPTVTTTAISDITATTATGGGTITDDGDSAVTAYGVCWNTTGTPVITDSHTHDEP